MVPRHWTSQFVLSLSLGVMLAAAPALGGFEGARVQAQESVPSVVREGYTRLGEGQVDGAIEIFQRAIRQYPTVLEAKLGLAIAYRRAGRDGDAWQTYQAVLQQDPDNTLALKTLGLLGGFRPEWQPAGIEALTRLLNRTPQDDEARAQRALLYGYQGRFAEALADYEQVLSKGNASPEVLVGAAQIYTYSGDYARGLELFNRYRSTGQALEQNAAIAYARALRGTGNPTQAISLLEGLVSNRTDDAAIQIRSELAQAYLDANRPADALAVLEVLRGRPEARLPLARALNEIGQAQKIPDLLNEAAALYRAELQATASPASTLILEAADVLSGIPAERPYALELYRRLIGQNPNDRVLGLKLLALESQLGQVNDSQIRQRLAGLLQPFPTSPTEQRAIAQALVPIEPLPELLPVYQQFLAAQVDVPFLNFRIAQLLIQANDFVGALAALTAYQRTPSGAQDLAPQLLYAEIERRQGRLEDSATRYIAILNTGTSDADIRSAAIQGLAGIRLAQDRPRDAIALYDRLLAANPGDLPLQLSRAAIAYQADLMSEDEAAGVLNRWLQSRPGETSPELYTLAGTLPARQDREALYGALAAADPTYIPVQVRWVEAIALRNEYQARAQVDRLVNQSRALQPNSATSYLLEAQLAQALKDLDRAGQAYDIVLQREPYQPEALAGLAGLRFQQRRYDEAARLYGQILTYSPNDRLAQQSLAELLVVQGRKLDALDQFRDLRRAGVGSGSSALRMRQIQEDFLRQRGFQPAWERF